MCSTLSSVDSISFTYLCLYLIANLFKIKVLSQNKSFSKRLCVWCCSSPWKSTQTLQKGFILQIKYCRHHLWPPMSLPETPRDSKVSSRLNQFTMKVDLKETHVGSRIRCSDCPFSDIWGWRFYLKCSASTEEASREQLAATPGTVVQIPIWNIQKAPQEAWVQAPKKMFLQLLIIITKYL